MAKKTGGRLPFQAMIARSVCIAHAIFDATLGPDLVIYAQSREVKRILRVPEQIGLYIVQLVHPLTYAQTILAPPQTVGLYGHARAHISEIGGAQGQGIPCSFLHMIEDIEDEDPLLSMRHFCGIAATTPGVEGPVATDAILEVSIFDVLEPEKRYVAPPQGGGGVGLRAAPKTDPLKFAALFAPKKPA